MEHAFKTLNRHHTNASKWEGEKKNVKDPEDMLVFSVADSDYETAPAIKEAVLRRAEHGAYGYTAMGKNYREIIKDWMERRYGLTIRPTWVIPLPKVLNGISQVMRTYTNEGDKVLIQTPVYHVFTPLIKNNNRVLVENKLIKKTDNRYTIDFDDLETQFKSGVKMFLLCSPHNPIGRIWTKAELNRMVALCRQYDVLLVSDEIHADFILFGNTFTSIGTFFDDYDNIILISAPGKTFNLAGLHSAHMVIVNTKIRGTMKNIYHEIHLTGINLFALEAIKTAYTKCDDWVDAQNRHIEANITFATDYIHKNIKPGIVTPVEGTYLLWVDIAFTGMHCDAFVKALMKAESVVLSEGQCFGGNAQGHIRINTACSKMQLQEGLKRIRRFVDTLDKGSQ